MDDCEIVQLYWDRNEQAIPATARKYGNYCTTIARNILDSTEDAEECVNDTYLNAWNSIPPRRPEILSAFLGKITRNLALNRYKHNTADKRGGGAASAVLDELAECISNGNTPEQEIDRKELTVAINSFLSALPAVKRQIFVSRYWYFDSVADIAARFGMSANHISVILNRLRRQLHNYLSERGFDL